MSKIVSLLVLAVLITSCDEKKTIYVGPNLVNCEVVGNRKCMQVKENKGDEWQLFYDHIEGFDYEEGFTYKLEVKVSKIENPPADGNSLEYKLIKVIYQEPSIEKIAIEPSLLGQWKVDKINGLDSLPKQPTLTFADGKVSGNAGCNRYSASYNTAENAITIGIAMTTKMYCSHMDIEKAFFDCLQKIKSFEIKDNRLYFYSENNEQLISLLAEN